MPDAIPPPTEADREALDKVIRVFTDGRPVGDEHWFTPDGWFHYLEADRLRDWKARKRGKAMQDSLNHAVRMY